MQVIGAWVPVCPPGVCDGLSGLPDAPPVGVTFDEDVNNLSSELNEELTAFVGELPGTVNDPDVIDQWPEPFVCPPGVCVGLGALFGSGSTDDAPQSGPPDGAPPLFGFDPGPEFGDPDLSGYSAVTVPGWAVGLVGFSDPPLVGSLPGAFDVVNVQEDFAYHPFLP